ncbi:MAG: dihydrolipoyl dehydrogenase [Chloroflexi bacterium]|nr:dihydrolipoyl dehydrogenase [Chloroflexota bacterium]
MTIRADLAVIGTGPGGYVAALRAAQLGAKVVCIEKQWVGGVCLNEGCIPTKALLRNAEVFATVREAAAYGVVVGAPEVDWPAMQTRKAKIIAQMTGGVTKLLERAGVQVVMGTASFLRPTVLEVKTAEGSEHVEADNVIIATGSRTMKVPIPGLDGPNVLDHSGIMSLDKLPASLCVIGGGAIGLEYASLMTELGVQVTVVEMQPRLAPLMDQSIGEGLAWSLGNRGVEILTGARVTSVNHDDSGATVVVSTAEGERQIKADKVLSAIGRSPNIEDIGLEVIGLNATRKGIGVDDRMRTAVPHVYAIGDVAAEGPMLAHVASHQGVVAAEDALGHPARMDYRTVPSCIFTLPEAAGVGMTEEQARAAGYEVLIGRFGLANNGKAVAYGDTDGFVKVVAEAKHKALLGMHIVGPHASDLIVAGGIAIELEATLDEIEHTIHAHPTLGESIHEAALAAMDRALHLPAKRK